MVGILYSFLLGQNGGLFSGAFAVSFREGNMGKPSKIKSTHWNIIETKNPKNHQVSLEFGLGKIQVNSYADFVIPFLP